MITNTILRKLQIAVDSAGTVEGSRRQNALAEVSQSLCTGSSRVTGREPPGVYSPQAEAILHKLGLAVHPEEIQSQLQRILSSRVFAASARMNRFLRFAVEETIAGRGEDLKEITIGFAVFDRAPDYDPRIDPIVRVEARRLREKLAQYYDADGKQDSIIIELPRGGYAPVFHQRAESAAAVARGITETSSNPAEETTTEATAAPARSSRNRIVIAIVIALALLSGFAIVTSLVGTKARATRERDSVLLADFVNRTGEPVFDYTLRQALAAQLSQSPFLSIVPEERVRETLRAMGRPNEDALTHELALEVCRRQSVKAMLNGSISTLGRRYVVSLDAVNCETGEAIARQQTQVQSKERVLQALGKMASSVRGELGESLASIQRFACSQIIPREAEFMMDVPHARQQMGSPVGLRHRPG